MKTIKLYSIVLVAIMLFAYSQQAFAQLPNAYIYNTAGWNSFLHTTMSNSVMQNARNGKGSGGSRSTSSSEPFKYEVPAYRRYLAVQFKSTGTRLTVKEAAELLDPVPADRPETEKILSGMMDKYEAAARDKGYPNDWALAYVSYIGLNSHVYNRKTDGLILPFEQNVGLRDVVAEYATDNGTFNNVTDQKKQELYELLVMLGGLTYHFYEKALRENNAEELKNCKEMATHNLRLLGIRP